MMVYGTVILLEIEVVGVVSCGQIRPQHLRIDRAIGRVSLSHVFCSILSFLSLVGALMVDFMYLIFFETALE